MAHSLIAADSIDAQPVIRRIGFADLKDVLERGIDDFAAMPSHAVFLCLIYPIIGLILIGFSFGYQVLPLVYPLMAGFALIGPLAAIGFYELSRRREAGLEPDVGRAFDFSGSPSLGSIALLGLLLMGIFLAWLGTAQAIYQSLFGLRAPASILQFANDLFTTRAGWTLILLGNAAGFVFAAVVFVISAISFPMLVDRDAGAAEAVLTSVRAVIANPGPMTAWGLIVAASLLLG